MPNNKETLNENVPEILTAPMSEAELQQYMGALNSEEAQAMIRDYHKSELLAGAQQTVMELVKQQDFHVTEILLASIDIWLNNLNTLHEESFDNAFVNRWKAVPDILCRVLLYQASEAFKSQQHQMEADVAPETEEMVRDWLRALPNNPETDPRPEFREACLIAFETYEQDAKKIENLKVLAVDYMEVWTHILLQIYILGILQESEPYLLLATHWPLFMNRFPDIMEALVLLKGYEELLLPENKDQLAAVLRENQQRFQDQDWN
jgi:hypothetical protein